MDKAKLIAASCVMPGVYDALSTKIASRRGFEVTFITGSAT
jgi:2-methylisocitrate lyase-like PEP mutase family enzyme